MRSALMAAVTLMMFQSAQAASKQHVDFINDGDSSAVSIEWETPGSEDWTPVTLSDLTHGGNVDLEGGYMGQAMTMIDANRGCVYDVRIDFVDHEALIFTGFNVCRAHTVHIGQQWHRALLGKGRAFTWRTSRFSRKSIGF
jgi:hypothetical protein